MEAAAIKTELSESTKKTLAERGALYLRAFHVEYEKDRIGPRTEYWRGHLSDWRLLLSIIYGEAIADEMVDGASYSTGLSIPHCGPLTKDGDGYLGTDAGSHPFIGRLR